VHISADCKDVACPERTKNVIPHGSFFLREVFGLEIFQQRDTGVKKLHGLVPTSPNEERI
jgi:hypothetical protein